MITKKSKGDALYLYTPIKYKSITVYIKNKTGSGTQVIVSKGTLHFEYAFKE